MPLFNGNTINVLAGRKQRSKIVWFVIRPPKKFIHRETYEEQVLKVSVQALILDHIIELLVCSLSGHFVRATMTAKCWSPSCLENCLDFFVTSFQQGDGNISQKFISASQRRSMGLRSGDCGGPWRTLNSQTHCIILLEVAIR